MSEALVLKKKEKDVMTLSLNRPEKKNAISFEMAFELEHAVEEAALDGEVRIVVLRGEGDCFSSGIDFNSLAEINSRFPQTREFRFMLEKLQRVGNTLEKMEKPVIAVLDKYCYGMGTEIATAADFRIAAEGTKIGIQEVELGLIPDVGGTTRITRLVGIPTAKELIMAARVMDAGEALEVRLVNEVVAAEEIDAALARWIEKLRGCAPLAVGVAKKIIDRCSHLDKMTFMEIEGIAQSTLLKTEDVMEGVTARIQKRRPDFKGK